MPTVEYYLMKSKQDAGRLPHWSLMILDPLTDDQRNGRTNEVLKGTRYHSKGGPTTAPDAKYTRHVENNSNFRSMNVTGRTFLGTIPYTGTRADFDNKMKAISNSVQPQQCQKYVVCFLARMAKKGHIQASVAEGLAKNVSMGPTAAAYEAKPGNYPAEPEGITLPATWPRPAPSRPSSSGSATAQRPSSSGSATAQRPSSSGSATAKRPSSSGSAAVKRPSSSGSNTSNKSAGKR